MKRKPDYVVSTAEVLYFLESKATTSVSKRNSFFEDGMSQCLARLDVPHTKDFVTLTKISKEFYSSNRVSKGKINFTESTSVFY